MKVTANRRELMFAVGLAAVMLLAVSAAAGAQSAGHMYAMATLNGEPRWRALLFPVSVDGTILASTVVLYVDHRLDRDGNTLAKWLLAIGVIISVLANVFHDWQHMAAGKLISAIGPLALFGIFHLFTQMVRSMAGVIPDKPVKQPKVAKATAAAAPEPAAAAPRRVRIGPVRRPARVARLAGHTRPGKPAKQAVAARPVLVSVPPPPAAAPPAAPKQHRKQKRRTNANVSEAEVQAYWLQNPGASVRELNRRFGISTTTASRWRSTWMDNVTT